MTRSEKWTLHLATWEDCTLCSLKETRSNVLIGEGATLPCDLLVLGLAPTISDNTVESVFSGREGIWFREQIATTIPEQYKVYMGNLLGCHLSSPKSVPKKTLTKYLKCCQPRVVELLDIANPKVILCLGKELREWMEQLRVSRSVEVVYTTSLQSILRSVPPHSEYLEAEFNLQLREIVTLLENNHAKDHTKRR